MRLGLVISGVMTRPGSLFLVRVVRNGVVITGGRGYAWMRKQGKRELSAHPVVYCHVHGGEKKGQKDPTAHEASHGERLVVYP